MNAEQTWSWTLRSENFPHSIAERREGYPTEEAATEAAEEAMRARAGENWKRQHPHLTIMISGPNKLYRIGGRTVRIVKAS